MRRARRGRAFRVRVRGFGDTLTGVRVLLRDSLNRRVGSSTPFMLKGRTRKPASAWAGGCAAGATASIATGAERRGDPGADFTERLRIKRRR